MSTSHDPIDLPAFSEGLDIRDDAVEQSLPCLGGAPGGVRSDEKIFESSGAGDEEGMLGGGGLGRQHVDGGAADGFGLERGDEVGFVDEVTATGVDEDGTGLHQLERFPIDEMPGLGSERTMQGDGVGGSEKGFVAEARDRAFAG